MTRGGFQSQLKYSVHWSRAWEGVWFRRWQSKVSSVMAPQSSCVVLPLFLLSFFLCVLVYLFSAVVLICAIYLPLLCQPNQPTTPHSQLPSTLSVFVNN